ncbi:MAG: hypothetical protein Q9203_007758, partial [Teloschistes exilis]
MRVRQRQFPQRGEPCHPSAQPDHELAVEPWVVRFRPQIELERDFADVDGECWIAEAIVDEGPEALDGVGAEIEVEVCVSVKKDQGFLAEEMRGMHEGGRVVFAAVPGVGPRSPETFSEREPLGSEDAAGGKGGEGPDYSDGLAFENVVVYLEADFEGQAEEACGLRLCR